MKKDKELIDEIVDRLKAKEDYTYKKGAWERFQKMDSSKVSGNKVRHMSKYVSVAAMLLIGFFVTYYLLVNKKDLSTIVKQPKEVLAFENENRGTAEEKDNSNPINVKPSTDLALIEPSYHEDTKATFQIAYLKNADLKLKNEMSTKDLISLNPMIIKATVGKLDFTSGAAPKNINSSIPLIDHFVLANATVGHNVIASTDVEKKLSPKSFKFNEKFDLGLFVSPYSTSDNLRIGAGLTLAYNLSNSLSIRTGASYNTYEVGILKNPLAASSVEQVEARIPNSPTQEYLNGNSFAISKFALPNINAVTGFVQSVEIPLEVKYSLNRTLYAAAGVSYSTIINQERNAQYVENVNFDTFSNGFPTSEQEASKALKAVTKTIKSAEKNVNTNGYNGFVNFSIGKKVNLNKKFNLSIEPYYKIPLGEFRNADMNYSNGGVRIMTNF